MEEKTNWLYMGGTGLVTLGILFVGIKYMHTLLTWFHILVCIGLVLVVLLQSGRAADLAGAFGGSGSQTAFGPRGAATFLAVVFMLTSLSLALISSQGATSVVTDTAPITEESAPAEAPSEETTEGDTEAEDPAPDASPEQEQ
jgi:preprotein translocase subunit SecG